MLPEPGIYRHYKNQKEYQVIGVGKIEANLEEVVVYQALYPSDTKFWIRPVDDFTAMVEWEGKPVPRFTFVRAA